MSAIPIPEFGPRGGWYAPYRTIYVPTDLDMLRGPLEGVVRLPSHINTSTRAWYDLADPSRRRMLYAVVIREAWKVVGALAGIVLGEGWMLRRVVRAALRATTASATGDTAVVVHLESGSRASGGTGLENSVLEGSDWAS